MYGQHGVSHTWHTWCCGWCSTTRQRAAGVGIAHREGRDLLGCDDGEGRAIGWPRFEGLAREVAETRGIEFVKNWRKLSNILNVKRSKTNILLPFKIHTSKCTKFQVK